MKSLYITSVDRFSGKTAVCLALGKRFQADGYRVGYLKPLSLQPWRIEGAPGEEAHLADEDAAFVKEVLNLEAPAWELSPVVLTPELLTQQVDTASAEHLIDRVTRACDLAATDKDILLLEGGGSLREGYFIGLPTPEVARLLASQVLVIARYRGEVNILDDVLASKARLGDLLCGIIINRVHSDAMPFVIDTAVPLLQKRGIPVLGVLPEVRGLAALTVGELIQILHAEVLTRYNRQQALVENLTVGAMTAEAALSRFRRYTNKGVITGGDRTDIQLAALETSTTCLILTGNLRPSPLIVKQADEFGVAVLLVRMNTMETVEAIERMTGKTRLGQTTKLKQFQALMDQHFDYARLYQALGLTA